VKFKLCQYYILQNQVATLSLDYQDIQCFKTIVSTKRRGDFQPNLDKNEKINNFNLLN
jgi:hypothetical protein